VLASDVGPPVLAVVVRRVRIPHPLVVLCQDTVLLQTNLDLNSVEVNIFFPKLLLFSKEAKNWYAAL
jgi:hypothetical protein